MKPASLLNPALIKCGLAARTKEEALDEIVDVLVAGTPGVVAEEFRKALAEREKLGPFSMAKGSAFPHARTEKLSDFRIAVGTAPQGIDFKAPDGNPIRVVVLFVIPKRHSNLYLHTLAKFLTILGNEENLQRITQARTGEELIGAVEDLSSLLPSAPSFRTVPSVTGDASLAKALELLAACGLDAIPVVDAEGNLKGELDASALLQFGVRGNSPNRPAMGNVLQSHAAASIESLGLIQPNGFRTVQEEEPPMEMAVKLSHAGARGAYVLQGTKLVGVVSTGEILRRLSGEK